MTSATSRSQNPSSPTSSVSATEKQPISADSVETKGTSASFGLFALLVVPIFGVMAYCARKKCNNKDAENEQPGVEVPQVNPTRIHPDATIQPLNLQGGVFRVGNAVAILTDRGSPRG